MFSLLSFLLLIGIMILIHELGHYWAARYFDVKVDTFSFGFGPRLFGWRRGETDFRVSAVPLGGYVKMSGDQPGDPSLVDEPRSFLNKPRWNRLIIAFAGPFMNIVLAVGLLTGLYMVKFPKPVEADAGVIGLILKGSAGSKSGLQEGDRLVSFDGQAFTNWEDFDLHVVKNAQRPIKVVARRNGADVDVTLTPDVDEHHGVGISGVFEKLEVQVASVDPDLDAFKQGLRAGDVILSANGTPVRSMNRLPEIIKATEGKPVQVVYRRDGKETEISLTPAYRERENYKGYMIGVHLQRRAEYVQLGFSDALVESTRRNIKAATLIYDLLVGIVEQRMSAKSLEGPIRIAQISGQAARMGADAFVDLMAGVSLNLAVLNLLPIPILDGGVILVLLIEMLFRRELSLQFKENIM
ncbi:MAG: RIP metalloprotease RseP, partial [Bryobacteraceae bacterium]